MSPPSWALIVLRAWLDTDGLRVRLLSTNSAGVDAEVVVKSPEDAAVVVCAWLRAVTQDVTGE
jgi:hypothetical protein